MMNWFAGTLGLLPSAPKTGAREGALFMFLCVLAVTIGAMVLGPDMFSAMTGVLLVMWSAATGAMMYAFKLKATREDEADIPEGLE